MDAFLSTHVVPRLSESEFWGSQIGYEEHSSSLESYAVLVNKYSRTSIIRTSINLELD
jgi:hypothetical protein